MKRLPSSGCWTAAMMVAVLSVAGCASARPSGVDESALAEEVRRQQGLGVTEPIGERAETMTICAGQNVPGWLKVDDHWNPTICGNPTSIQYNVWTIERIDNKPVNSVMTACMNLVPAGWVMVNSTWNPTRCGRPTIITHNIMVIRRLS